MGSRLEDGAAQLGLSSCGLAFHGCHGLLKVVDKLGRRVLSQDLCAEMGVTCRSMFIPAFLAASMNAATVIAARAAVCRFGIKHRRVH